MNLTSRKLVLLCLFSLLFDITRAEVNLAMSSSIEEDKNGKIHVIRVRNRQLKKKMVMRKEKLIKWREEVVHSQSSVEAQTNSTVFFKLDTRKNYLNEEIDLLDERINQFNLDAYDDVDDKYMLEEYLAGMALNNFEDYDDLRDLKYDDVEDEGDDEKVDEKVVDYEFEDIKEVNKEGKVTMQQEPFGYEKELGEDQHVEDKIQEEGKEDEDKKSEKSNTSSSSESTVYLDDGLNELMN